MKSKSVLFFYNNFSSFVRTDFEILSSAYSVRKYGFKPVKGLINTGIELVKQFFFLLLNIWEYDAVYVWFADYHSFLPVMFAKILGKESYVVIGGYDICRDRKLGYGSFCSGFRGFFSAMTIRNCTLNFTVSNYVDRKVKFVFPKAKHLMVYNCIHIDLPDNKLIAKEKMILCVAIVETERTYLRKGIDTFLELSALLPDYRFVVVGPHNGGLSLFPDPLPANFSVFERLQHNDLIDYFLKASFYCQLSRIEIFGVAIGEAMLNGCIPFVTNVGGMPEVVGCEGEVVPRDIEKITALIRELEWQDTTARRDACRERIVTRFSFAKRKGELLAALGIPEKG